MKPILEIDQLQWSETREISIPGKGRVPMKSAPPSEGFWSLWRENKDQLKDCGITVSSFKGQWSVNWWSRDGAFQYPNLADISDPIAAPDLAPLVNEKNLYPYQLPLVQRIVAAMNTFGCALNGCGTGVGKTFITLGANRERARRLLVICPKPIREDWVRSAHYIGVELAGVYGWEWIKTGKTPFGSWEMIPSKTPKGKAKKGRFIWSVPDDVDIVFDECHRAAAIDTQNATIVICAKDQGYSIHLLSATIANDPTKMRATGYVLGLHSDGREFYSWMGRHGVKQIDIPCPGGRNVKVWKFIGGPRHLQAIHSQIFPAKGCRVTAEELGDAFPRTQIVAKAYEMDEESEINKAYREMEERVEEIMAEKGENTQANILVEILRARQKVELLKVPLIISLTRDYVEEGNSVFIAINFKDTLKQLVEGLNLKAVIVGGQKDFERRDAIDDFQHNRLHVIAGIIQACREGLNLHDLHGRPRVSLIVPPPSAFNLKQVLGRVHRAGGKSPSIQRILFAANTIEESVCKSLATKLDQLDLLMDGDLRDGIFPPAYSTMRSEDEEES